MIPQVQGRDSYAEQSTSVCGECGEDVRSSRREMMLGSRAVIRKELWSGGAGWFEKEHSTRGSQRQSTFEVCAVRTLLHGQGGCCPHRGWKAGPPCRGGPEHLAAPSPCADLRAVPGTGRCAACPLSVSP